jgi:hypothetical protein
VGVGGMEMYCGNMKNWNWIENVREVCCGNSG